MSSYIVKKKEYQVVEDLKDYMSIVENEGNKYILYHFGDNVDGFGDFKFAYKRLKTCGITIPKVLEIDKKNHTFLVEYLDAKNCFQILIDEDISPKIFEKLYLLNYMARRNGYRLDFNPQYFIYYNDKLYYTAFTFTSYLRDQDFTQKEIRYWYYTKEFHELLISKGIPVKNARLVSEFERNKQIVLDVVQYFR